MADNLNKKLSDLEKKLKRIEFLSKQLGKNINTVNLKPVAENADIINSLFDDLEEKFYRIGEQSDYLVSQFSQLAGEIKNSQSGINKAASAFRGLSSIAQQVSDYQKGITDLTGKQISKLQQQAKEKKNQLKTSLLTLKVERDELIQKQNSLKSEKAILDEKLRVSSLTDAEFKKRKQLNSQINKTDDNLIKNFKTQGSINDLIDNENASLDMLNDSLNSAYERSEAIKDTMGLTGAAVSGLASGLEKAGFGKLASRLGLDEAQDKMKALAKEIVDGKKKEESLEKLVSKATGKNKEELKEQLKIQKGINSKLSGGNSKMAIMKEGLKSMGASFKKNLLDPAAIYSFLIDQFIKAFIKADSATGDLAKKMNMTYSQASQTRQQLGKMADASGDSALNAGRLQNSLIAINSSLGTNAKISEDDLKTFTKLREQAGMTNEEIMGMQKYSMVMGGTLKGNVQEFQAAAKIMSYQKGVAVNTKQLMADMGKLSASTKLSIKGGAGALAEQMVRAKAVGLELEKMNSIADKMLDFESSIEAELEAQMLTGKNVNFEKARQLSLNNDLAGAAEEIAAQVEKAGDFSEMNRIQQEAMAKAAGMTRNELADMLMEQEALKSLGKELNEEEREAYEAAKKKYGAEKAAKMLKEGQLDDMVAQQDIQERFAQSIEKLQGVFVRIMDLLMPIFDIFMKLADVVIPAINIAMKPIFYIFEAISGVLTGNMDKLSTTQKIVGGIATVLGGMWVLSKAMNAAQTIYLGLKSGELVKNSAILTSLTFQNAQAAYQLATQEGLSAVATLRLMAEETILGKMVLQGVQAVYNLGKSILTTIQSGFRLALEGSIITALAAQGLGMIKNLAKGAILLAQSIARAAAEMFAVSAATIGIGTAIAIAAAVAGVALLYSMTKGDDVFSPGETSSGYGKRTLFGPEGAIELNNKDSVIAGTDLFGDSSSNKKEGFQYSSKTPKTPKPNVNKTDALLSNLISEQRESNRLVRAGQNVNYDSFGTAASTSVFNISPG